MAALPLTSSALGPRLPARPMVSVIIIFLDEERFLAEAIESVLAQSYEHWELVLVDDGSVDASPAVARRYAGAHPGRIRCLTHPGRANLGMSASRNLGVAAARGELISYLDADDVWLEHKLEDQVGLLLGHPEVAFVYGPLTRWYSWADGGADDDLYGIEDERTCLETDRVYDPPELLCSFLRHKDLLPSGILVRRDAVVAVGGGEPAFRGNYEDAVVLVKLCLRHPAYLAGRSWYLYRQHDDSFCKTARRAGDGDAARLRFLDWVDDYLCAEGVRDRRIWAGLRAGRRRYRRPGLHRVVQVPGRVEARLKRMLVKRGQPPARHAAAEPR